MKEIHSLYIFRATFEKQKEQKKQRNKIYVEKQIQEWGLYTTKLKIEIFGFNNKQ
jgi:hypothetical protein